MITSGGHTHTGTTKSRILVAEDDDEMRKVLVDTIRLDGHEVHEVSDGASLLLELAQSSRFHFDAVDVVVSDVRMPLCSGLQAVQTIRAIRPRLPFVLLTAFGDEEMHARARALGVTLLDKPFSMAALRAAVGDALTRSRSRMR